MADKVSRAFEVGRGTKQGDPISPQLFNAVVEHFMGKLKLKWAGEGRGIDIDGCPLTNLRFADDILLLATSLADARNMLEDLGEFAAAVGLEIHMGRTKFMSNVEARSGASAANSITVRGHEVEILRFSDATTYLGRKLCFKEFHDTEIKHRIGRGWAKFAIHRKELCQKKYSLRCRLKLFEAVVTPTVLYGSSAWTMNAERARLLRTAQRRMLRTMLGSARRVVDGDGCPHDGSDSSSDDSPPGEEEDELTDNENDKAITETWVEWIVRTTRAVEAQLSRAKISDWCVAQCKRKWNFAGHTARRQDGRWSTRLLSWTGQSLGKRARGRPVTRWGDALDAFCCDGVSPEVGTWTMYAQCRPEWARLSEVFAVQPKH